MTHDEIKRKLSAFHDRELQLREMLEIRAHLSVCAECSREVRELIDLDMLLTPAAVVQDPEFAAEIMGRIIDRAPAAERLPSYTGWWKVPALALASCAVYAVCVETGLLPSGSDPFAAALAAQSEAQRLSSVLFGNSVGGSEQMLTMLLDGDKK